MNSRIDQGAADSALTTEPADQRLNLKMCKRGTVTLVTHMGDASIMRAFGTKDLDFFGGLPRQVSNAGAKGQYPDELGIKFMLAFIKAREPRDEIEATLLTQMAATHVAAMRFANRLDHAESLQEQDSAERAFNKLSRTFTAQAEALQRYRSSSVEKVIVQHVSVSDGGQAIVGNVTRPAHEKALRKRVRGTPVLGDARQSPMDVIGEPERVQVPLRRANG